MFLISFSVKKYYNYTRPKMHVSTKCKRYVVWLELKLRDLRWRHCDVDWFPRYRRLLSDSTKVFFVEKKKISYERLLCSLLFSFKTWTFWFSCTQVKGKKYWEQIWMQRIIKEVNYGHIKPANPWKNLDRSSVVQVRWNKVWMVF